MIEWLAELIDNADGYLPAKIFWSEGEAGVDAQLLKDLARCTTDHLAEPFKFR